MVWHYQNHNDLWFAFRNVLATVEYVYDSDSEDETDEDKEAVVVVVVFVFNGLRTGKYEQINRWRSFKLGQVFLQSYNLSLVIITYSSPACSTYLRRFTGLYYCPHPTYRSPISIICCCLTSLSAHPLPTSPPIVVRNPPGLFPPPSPASLNHLSLPPAPRT